VNLGVSNILQDEMSFGTNGDANANGEVMANMKLQFGLVNPDGKYLTAESFGFKINANGLALRKKQMWTFEQEAGSNLGYLKSPQGRYVVADKNGNIRCDGEEKEDDAKFEIEVVKDGSWGIKSHFGHYLVGNGDMVNCPTRKLEDRAKWAVHLSLHPQVNLRSISRKRFVRMDNDEMHADEDVPWGSDAVLTLRFLGARYALQASNGKFLNRNGKLVEKSNDDCELVLEFHDNFVAFKDKEGKYLIPYGPKGKIQSGKATLTASKDELYQMGTSHAQVRLVSHNGKNVSIKQGVDVTANQLEAEDTEIFQMEYTSDNKVAFKTITNKYWIMGAKGAITATSSEVKSEAEYDLEWIDNKIALKASNGKYLSPKLSGALVASADAVDEKEKFVLGIVNRPLLVLRGEFGYIGMRGNKIECNRGNYDVLNLIFEDNYYKIKAKNGKFFALDDGNNVVAAGDDGDNFAIVLKDTKHMYLKAVKNGMYLQGDQSGSLKATADKVGKNCIWEH